MKEKSSSQLECLFTRCLPIAFTVNDVGKFVHVCENTENPNFSKQSRYIFIPIISKIFENMLTKTA